MENLFYDKKNQIAFWIEGYSDTTEINNLIDLLKEGRRLFAKSLNTLRVDNIHTDIIKQSSRYKYMRYYWKNNISECPGGFFELGDDWTMNEWIKN